ncbi:porphobilinogen synthase [uncultured Tissierella sp.]|uniref:porphobilinogen synthase n=1 Tax=uncultured Tissierella sp. TaxID=448160 RepID=UPI002804E241|nr:porphobilinogen synthase [uncultured Tissierella sp.]MDU5080657.1 porphobilinogen synthase [Bacillota bacterium]
MNRTRRLRKNPSIRSMVRETKLSVYDFIYPLFIVEGENIKREISSMKGVYHFSVDKVLEEIKEIMDLGIKSIILFGIPDKKDHIGSEGYATQGIIQKAIRAIKLNFPEMYIVTDVCMCEYTSHGHCGIITEQGDVDNDETLSYLGKIALSHAEAGADMVAPSDMMDGRVGYIRKVLDENGFEMIPIMAYSAKYSSSFYGPFREAADSAPAWGDRKSYQMDPANSNEAIREVMYDIEEGADIVMVKPALSYLDIIRRVKDNFNMPIAAYNVSGEYSMIKMAIENGIMGEEIIMEVLTSIKRAGADIIISYFAKDVAKSLK